MSDLVEFLLARIGEIESTAHLARSRANGPFWVVTDADDAVGVDYDPVLVLAECAAKRAIIAEHAIQDVPVLEFRGRPVMSGPECRVCVDWDAVEMDGPPPVKAPCRTLRLLAQPYADHPEFDQEWRRQS